MRIDITIFNHTTGEKVYAISEPDIDSAIAHLGTYERQMKECLYCHEPLNSREHSYCDRDCAEGRHLEQQEDMSTKLHNPF